MKNMSKLNVYINFGGFYESTHSDVIENMLENYYDFQDYDWTNINYRLIQEKYCNNLVKFMTNFIPFDYENLELVSPREYNFTTDKIFVDISEEDCIKIIQYGLENYEEEMIELCKNYTTSCDGYIPYYTFDEVWEDTCRKTELVFGCMCWDSSFIESWVDNTMCYELLWDLDFEIKED